MIPIFKAGELTTDQVLTRNNIAQSQVEEIVSDIIATVRKEGDAALFAYAEKFDRAKLTALEVTAEEIDAACARIDPYFLETLEMARDNPPRR